VEAGWIWQRALIHVPGRKWGHYYQRAWMPALQGETFNLADDNSQLQLPLRGPKRRKGSCRRCGGEISLWIVRKTTQRSRPIRTHAQLYSTKAGGVRDDVMKLNLFLSEREGRAKMSEKKRELNYIISAGVPIVYRAETNTDAQICENPKGSGSLPHIAVELTFVPF
jgi:hypothetical protein